LAIFNSFKIIDFEDKKLALAILTHLFN